MTPLPHPVGKVLRTIGMLLAAIPRAWSTDRVFRTSVIASGVALATLVARPLVERPDTEAPSLPTPGVETAPSDAPLPPPGARYEDPATLAGPETTAPPSGPLAPGRTLEGLRIETDPDAPIDPFGTLRAADPPPAPKETP